MRLVLIGLFAMAPAAIALAQGGDNGWETSSDADLALVVATSPSDRADAPDFQSMLWEASLGARAERTLQSGTTIGARFVVRAQRDNPARPAGAGQFALQAGASPAGAVSRLSLGPGGEAVGPRASLETAYVFVETGYGEVTLGRDTGIAARFHEGDVGVLARGRLVDPYLDPSGLAAISTRADITGPSIKLSYVTPRLLGLRAGASFTPQADVRGLDRDATLQAGRLRPGLESVVELGLQGSRRLRESGVRLRAALSWSSGEVAAPSGQALLFDDRFAVLAAGGEVEWADRWRFGLNWLSADEGLASGADYTAWSTGLAYAAGDWRAALVYGRSEQDEIGLRSDGVSIELGRSISKRVDASLAWRDLGLDYGQQLGLAGPVRSAGYRGVVFEITLKAEN